MDFIRDKVIHPRAEQNKKQKLKLPPTVENIAGG